MKNFDLKETILCTTITEQAKKEFGNKDGFYDGIWQVKEINYREKVVDLSNGRVSISKKFDEINEINVANIEDINITK